MFERHLELGTREFYVGVADDRRLVEFDVATVLVDLTWQEAAKLAVALLDAASAARPERNGAP